MRLTARLFACIALCLLGLTGAVYPAMAVSLAAVSAPQTTPESLALQSPPDKLAALTERLKQVAQTIDAEMAKGNASASRTELLDIVAQPEFADLNYQVRWVSYYMLATIEYSTGNNEAAFAHMKLAGDTGAADTQFEHWRLLIDIGYRLKKYDTTAEAMTMMARIDPARVEGFDPEYVFGVAHDAWDLKDNDAHYKALVEVLRQARFKASDPYWSERTEDLWFCLFEIYVAEGQIDKAEAILPAITQPELVLRLRVDNRYRPYALKAELDYETALKTALDQTRRKAAANPRLLLGQHLLAKSLKEQNQLTEALEIADNALAAIKSAPKDKPAFDDTEDYLDMIQRGRVRIFAEAGQWDKVLQTQLELRSIEAPLNEFPVREAARLGTTYYNLERPKEALKSVQVIPAEAGLYEQMLVEKVRACAYAQLGDRKKLEKSLSFMRANARQAYRAYETALLCANDMDALAIITIAQLDEAKTRNDLLLCLQSFRPPTNSTNYQRILIERHKTLLARPDVKATIDRYGVIESVPIFYPFY